MRRPVLFTQLWAALAAEVVIAGCGGGEGGSDEVGPAAAVPSDEDDRALVKFVIGLK